VVKTYGIPLLILITLADSNRLNCESRATHVRIDNPLFSHVLFPVYIGIMLWAGLYFRNPQFQKLFKPA